MISVPVPAHVAQAIIGSIDNWEAWILTKNAPSVNGSAAALPDLAPIDDQDWQAVLSALPGQTKIWRNLVSGHKLPADRLTVRSYELAAESLVVRYRNLATTFLAQWWPYLLLLAIITGGVAALSLSTGGTTATKTIGLIATLAAAAGITGKTANSTIRKTVSHVGTSLWEAELDSAMAQAATVLPNGDAPLLLSVTKPTRSGREQRKAANAARSMLNARQSRLRAEQGKAPPPPT